MEPVNVAARFEQDGRIFPLHFTWHGRDYPVITVGRTWQDETGRHILVMTPGDKVVELIFRADQGRWYLRQPGGATFA